MEILTLRDDFIRLGQALKAAGYADSGLEAKIMINEGHVKVNGETETRRGRKLYADDIVLFEGKELKISK